MVQSFLFEKKKPWLLYIKIPITQKPDIYGVNKNWQYSMMLLKFKLFWAYKFYLRHHTFYVKAPEQRLKKIYFIRSIICIHAHVSNMGEPYSYRYSVCPNFS